MFCRYRCRSSAAATLLCLAALSILSIVVSQPIYAKANVQPVCATGDPDEFESRTAVGGSGGGRVAMSADPSEGSAQSVLADGELAAGAEGGARLQRKRVTLSLLIGRVVRFLAVELDVM